VDELLMKIDIPKDINIAKMEQSCCELWEKSGIYDYHPDSDKEVFSVDTPPPYVSSSHLHVGHAMSYTQAEFIVRYKRMKGYNIFYPMGFDDNGLPTERFVEKTYKINKRKTTRSEFRKICLNETTQGAGEYEKLWRKLGLSVDWSLRYSTIDLHCQRTSQKSFIELYSDDRVYRSVEPVIWDTHFETALAQADLDTITRKGQLHDISFLTDEGLKLVISTTRPELLPACVALYCNSNDERFKHLLGKQITVPLFNHTVLLRADDDVDMGYGTGLMMVCTFGDAEDVRRWKRDKLELRPCIQPNGRLSALAGPYEGMMALEGRKKILADLSEKGFLLGSKAVEQVVSIAERSETPVEYIMAPHWFIKILDLKGELLALSDMLNWHPDLMKTRLDQWITGLKYDWNITRQRFYGVPFPVWYCKSCGKPVLARIDDLPVDPLKDACPISHCPECHSTDFVGDEDVMDTWMTSSLTPLINANWAKSPGRSGDMDLHPMNVRVQAYEIIRTWAFYTIVKSYLHKQSVPWKDVMISGWGLNEQGKKISKRDLDKFTDASGFNRYNPYTVIEKYGADALRHWATNTHLGNNLKYSEKDVRDGRKIVVKLWNSARFCALQWNGFDPNEARPAVEQRTLEDRWIISELQKTIASVSSSLDAYDYGAAKNTLEKYFWDRYCDNYLEMVKDRFWHPERYASSVITSTKATLWETLRSIIALFAPFLPFVTEEIYQRIYCPVEGVISLHVSSWPEVSDALSVEVPEMNMIREVLDGVRKLRSDLHIPQNKQISTLIIDTNEETKSHLKQLELSVMGVTRAERVLYSSVPDSCLMVSDTMSISIEV
jgi:valyl-tRNA synthetase